MVKSTINKTVKLKSKLNDLWTKYFTSKEISSNHDYPFNFKNTNWYITIIYLVSFIVIPITYSLIKRYVFNIDLVNDELPKIWTSLELLIIFLVPIIGMIIIFAIDWNVLIKGGTWAAYTHFIFGIINRFFVGIFSIPSSSIVLLFLIQIITQFIGSLVVIFINKALRKQIIATLKEAKLDLLVWILIFSAIILWLNFIFNLISNSVNSNVVFASDAISANQKRLESMAKTPFGIFSLVLGAVFLAPVNEEISYRYGIFSIVRHKSLAFIASLIYFPAIHIMGYGDWNNIFGYLGMSIMGPLLFICTRGNTTYTIGLHMLVNAIAVINFFSSKT